MGRRLNSAITLFTVALILSAPHTALGLDFDKAIAKSNAQANSIANTLGQDRVQNKGDKTQKSKSQEKGMKVTLIRVRR